MKTEPDQFGPWQPVVLKFAITNLAEREHCEHLWAPPAEGEYRLRQGDDGEYWDVQRCDLCDSMRKRRLAR